MGGVAGWLVGLVKRYIAKEPHPPALSFIPTIYLFILIPDTIPWAV